jgi:spartin
MFYRYGADAAHSTSMLTGTAKNVGLVYIDMRGIGRRALIRRVGKEYVKGYVKSRSRRAERVDSPMSVAGDDRKT